jgi:hypothetical protein
MLEVRKVTSGVAVIALCVLLCLACFYLVVDHHYRHGKKAWAILLVVFIGFGFWFAYFDGWRLCRERYMRVVMVVWTLSIVALGLACHKPGSLP